MREEFLKLLNFNGDEVVVFFLEELKVLFEGTFGKEDAVEMVVFVLNYSCREVGKFLRAGFKFISAGINDLPFKLDPLMAPDWAVDFGNRQAAFE